MRIFEWFSYVDEIHNLNNDKSYKFIRALISSAPDVTREVYDLIDDMVQGTKNLSEVP